MALADVIAALRAASAGSASLDNLIADHLGVARGARYTRREADLLALVSGGAEFVLKSGSTRLDLDAIEIEDTDGEKMATIGTPPRFKDHSHGKHPTSAHLAAVACLLKFREGVR